MYYKPVPWVALLGGTIPSIAICAFILIRLATMSTCLEGIDAARDRVCVSPTFPIFDTSASGDRCACNTVVFSENKTSTNNSCGSLTQKEWRRQLEDISVLPSYVTTAFFSPRCAESVPFVAKLVGSMVNAKTVSLSGDRPFNRTWSLNNYTWDPYVENSDWSRSRYSYGPQSVALPGWSELELGKKVHGTALGESERESEKKREREMRVELRSKRSAHQSPDVKYSSPPLSPQLGNLKQLQMMFVEDVEGLEDSSWIEALSTGNLRLLSVVSIGWSRLSPLVAKIPALMELLLEGNEISIIPSEIFHTMPNLIQLELSYNRLTSLPSEVGLLSNLENLQVQGNLWLTSLP